MGLGGGRCSDMPKIRQLCLCYAQSCTMQMEGFRPNGAESRCRIPRRNSHSQKTRGRAEAGADAEAGALAFPTISNSSASRIHHSTLAQALSRLLAFSKFKVQNTSWQAATVAARAHLLAVPTGLPLSEWPRSRGTSALLLLLLLLLRNNNNKTTTTRLHQHQHHEMAAGGEVATGPRPLQMAEASSSPPTTQTSWASSMRCAKWPQPQTRRTEATSIRSRRASCGCASASTSFSTRVALSR